MRAALVSTILFAVATTASAGPHRVVVLDFDGPRELAETGRGAVVALLADEYDLVASRRWAAARAHAPGRGPKHWRKAAKAAQVDVVIEGWVQDEGHHHLLTLAVRDASTGNEIDTISVRIGDDGISNQAGRQLGVQLDDVFAFIDVDATTPLTSEQLPDVRAQLRGRRHLIRDDERGDNDTVRRTTAEAPDHEGSDDDAPPASVPTPRVASADEEKDKDTSDLVQVFGPESKEAAIARNAPATAPRRAPRFRVDAGPYLSSRGMTFDYDTTVQAGPPTYPASSIAGLGVSAAVFPRPADKHARGLSGIGFSVGLARSVGATLTAMDTTGYGDYTIEHSAWDLGAHYRWSHDLVTIAGDVVYGSSTHTLVDFPESIAIPDTAYTHIGIGGRLELAVTDRASVGVGGRYLYVLGTGDVSAQDWYGAGTAWGMTLDADFTIPCGGPLFVRGALQYRRMHMEFEGSGALARTWGVWSANDTSITGNAHLGVLF